MKMIEKILKIKIPYGHKMLNQNIGKRRQNLTETWEEYTESNGGTLGA